MPVIEQFENKIANFFGCKYAVATDSCTHAIELSLRLEGTNNITLPKYTYASIPMTCMKLNLNWGWNDDKWQDYYYLKGSNIIDAAVLWRRNSYIPNTFMCLSFQCKKHLGLFFRGGMILLDDEEKAKKLKLMSNDGRDFNKPWQEQDIKSVGYHYHMTPETAEIGIKEFEKVKDFPPKQWSWKDYIDISNMSVFNNLNN